MQQTQVENAENNPEQDAKKNFEAEVEVYNSNNNTSKNNTVKNSTFKESAADVETKPQTGVMLVTGEIILEENSSMNTTKQKQHDDNDILLGES